MYATKDYGRRLASARLIQQAGADLQESAGLSQAVAEFLGRAEPGPGGMLFMDSRRVATLLRIVEGTAGHTLDALGSLNAAAALLQGEHGAFDG